MNKKTFLIVIICFTAFLSYGQLPLPKLTEEKLKIFEPYFGKYKQTMDYGGKKWSGTMEIKKIIKGWYVDWTILTKSEDNTIDREYHMMVTYDTAMNKYRVWRFETGANWNDYPITVSTEGTDIIVALQFPQEDSSEIFYNRYSKPSKDEIKIVTELHSKEGKVLRKIGITTATRIKQDD
ncbi:MAG: hypothetical protein EOO10_00350 [Chitinophagaceae bacterium]|nr:MAG: hypothetical protein EOO10_00350 [Chitinophagaceae bacterium]